MAPIRALFIRGLGGALASLDEALKAKSKGDNLTLDMFGGGASAGDPTHGGKLHAEKRGDKAGHQVTRYVSGEAFHNAAVNPRGNGEDSAEAIADRVKREHPDADHTHTARRAVHAVASRSLGASAEQHRRDAGKAKQAGHLDAFNAHLDAAGHHQRASEAFAALADHPQGGADDAKDAAYAQAGRAQEASGAAVGASNDAARSDADMAALRDAAKDAGVHVTEGAGKRVFVQFGGASPDQIQWMQGAEQSRATQDASRRTKTFESAREALAAVRAHVASAASAAQTAPKFPDEPHGPQTVQGDHTVINLKSKTPKNGRYPLIGQVRDHAAADRVERAHPGQILRSEQRAGGDVDLDGVDAQGKIVPHKHNDFYEPSSMHAAATPAAAGEPAKPTPDPVKAKAHGDAAAKHRAAAAEAVQAGHQDLATAAGAAWKNGDAKAGEASAVAHGASAKAAAEMHADATDVHTRAADLAWKAKNMPAHDAHMAAARAHTDAAVAHHLHAQHGGEAKRKAAEAASAKARAAAMATRSA